MKIIKIKNKKKWETSHKIDRLYVDMVQGRLSPSTSDFIRNIKGKRTPTEKQLTILNKIYSDRYHFDM